MLKCNLDCLQKWCFGSFCCNHSTLFADNISDFEDILCDKWSKWSTKRVTHCTFISILYLTVHLANTFNALSAWIINDIERKRMSPTMAYSYFWRNVQMWGFWRKCCLREAIKRKKNNTYGCSLAADWWRCMSSRPWSWPRLGTCRCCSPPWCRCHSQLDLKWTVHWKRFWSETLTDKMSFYAFWRLFHIDPPKGQV